MLDLLIHSNSIIATLVITIKNLNTSKSITVFKSISIPGSQKRFMELNSQLHIMLLLYNDARVFSILFISIAKLCFTNWFSLLSNLLSLYEIAKVFFLSVKRITAVVLYNINHIAIPSCPRIVGNCLCNWILARLYIVLKKWEITQL